MFTTLLGECRFYKTLFIKKHTFLWRRGTLLYSSSIHFHLFTCVFYLKMVEWNHRNMFWGSKQMNVLCSDVVFCVDLNHHWNTVLNLMSNRNFICTFPTFCAISVQFDLRNLHIFLFLPPFILWSPAWPLGWCLLPCVNPLS
jgi:hypothetical protein